MATPHVAGVAALMFWRTPARPRRRSAPADRAVDDLGTAGRDSTFGFGRVNLCKAMGGSCAYTPGTP